MRRILKIAFAMAAMVGVLTVAQGLADPQVARAEAPAEQAAPIVSASNVAPDGTVLVVSCADGRLLSLRSTASDGTTSAREVRLALPEGARIADIGICPWLWAEGRKTVALTLAVTRATGREYRYAVETTDEANGARWSLSDAIFQDEDSSWRIVDVRNVPGGDTLEVLFARGHAAPQVGGKNTYEARLYTNDCPGAGAMYQGMDALTFLKPAK